MRTIARFIVKYRYCFLAAFVLFGALCGWALTRVNVEYSIASYLPEKTDTRRALDVMEVEFPANGTAQIVLRGVTKEQAAALAEEVAAVEGVKSVGFDGTDATYRDSTALFDVTYGGADGDKANEIAHAAVLAVLKDADPLAVTEPGNGLAARLSHDVSICLILSVVVITAVLLFTSRSFAEVPVFFLTFAMAALLNMGTNSLFPSVSFVADSVCVILQLALAIDYAIILSHRFTEEKQRAADAKDAMAEALARAFPEICGSSLTTVAGLIALTTMSLRLGLDLGLVLAKGILLSMLTVFLFMPALLLLLSRAIDKTRHRNFVPKVTALGRLGFKARYVLPAVFVALIAVAGYFAFRADYVYSSDSIDTYRPSAAQRAIREKEEAFGRTNTIAVLLPKSAGMETERAVYEYLTVEGRKYLGEDAKLSVTSVAGLEFDLGGTVIRTDGNLRPSDLRAALGTFAASYLFQLYCGNRGIDYSSDAEYSAADFLDYLASDACRGEIAGIPDSFFDASSRALYERIADGWRQLSGENWTRTAVVTDLPREGERTFGFVRTMSAGVKAICPDAILAGDSVSSSDLDASFTVDNVKVSVLTVGFVLIILLFTFRAFLAPFPLVLTIEGGIFLNFAYYALFGVNIFFFDYLIVSAIQMGATIDYAIVLTNRYEEYRKTLPREKAIGEAVNGAFPTVMTSGTIMAVAGFVIGGVVRDPMISTLGLALGRGVVLSVLAVLFVLPAMLALLDKPFFRSKFTKKLRGAVCPSDGMAGGMTDGEENAVGEKTAEKPAEEVNAEAAKPAEKRGKRGSKSKKRG